jgi:hypothetical protein
METSNTWFRFSHTPGAMMAVSGQSSKPMTSKKFESEKSWWATIEQICATDHNLTAGCYCPHQAKAVEHEKPEVLINRLLELEEEITDDLHQLLAGIRN